MHFCFTKHPFSQCCCLFELVVFYVTRESNSVILLLYSKHVDFAKSVSFATRVTQKMNELSSVLSSTLHALRLPLQ